MAKRLISGNNAITVGEDGRVTYAVGQSLPIIATTTGIDAKTAASTTIYTVPAGKSFVLKDVIIRVTAFTVGSKTTDATIYIGTSPAGSEWHPTTDNLITVVANNTYFSIGSPGKFDNVDVFLGFPVLAAGTSLDFTVDTPSDATTETWAVDVVGYLV